MLQRTRTARSGHANALSPLDRMISLWLALAKAESATAIVIGMPRQIPASIGRQNEAAFRDQLTREHDLPTPSSDDQSSRAIEESSRLRSVAGWRSVPVWMEHAGQLYPMPGPPIELQLALLCRVQERLLSLGASEGAPKPMRYIEYDSDDSMHRCFAEVELLLLEDNTVRIEIVRHRREPASVRAVASVY